MKQAKNCMVVGNRTLTSVLVMVFMMTAAGCSFPVSDNSSTVCGESSFLKEEAGVTATGTDYILNTNTFKFHYPDCSSVEQMSPKNKESYTGTREEVMAMGYSPCGRCCP